VTIGFGAAVLIGSDSGQLGRDLIMNIDKGGNMAGPLLAEALGGPMFLGFLAAVAFATILAVVAGLTLAGASALSHDLYVGVIRRGQSNEKEEVKVAKIATVILGVTAMLLAMAFKGQNVAFMVGLAFAIAASANFPALILSLMWKRFSTQAAVWSIYTGMISAVLFIVLSPTVYVDILHKDAKDAITKQVAEIDGKVKTADAEIDALTKQIVAVDAIAKLKKSEHAAATKKNTELQSSIDGKKKDKDALAAQKKDANAKMPVAPVKYRNPGVFSMALAFLVGILFSYIFPEKDAEEKFATEKLREYVGIGAE
jgi:cation/acetate symporter